MPLTGIKKYVLDELCKASKSIAERENDFGEFLSRFIDEVEVEKIDKRPVPAITKVSKQLLCCIAIDIRKGIVPIEHYVKIFEKIDIKNQNVEARLLFDSTINDNNLEFHGSCVKTTSNFSICICSLKDWKHYIDPKTLGLVGHDQSRYCYDKVCEYFEDNNGFNIHFDLLEKRGKRYFWVCTQSEYQSIAQSHGNPAVELADKLGLSHINFDELWNKKFFFIQLEGVNLCTMSPNATLVDWSWPDVGFLSDLKIDSGRTYSITGKINYNGGVKERVFQKHSLTIDEKKMTSLSLINGEIDRSLNIAYDDIIEEGINRFIS